MYSLLWSEHCAYKHSKKLLRTLPTEGEHVVMGPGENAGRGRRRRRAGVRVQGRVAQPPERRRALPGRRHRRRRDPARHLRDRRAADRRARLAALRRAGDERARALPARRARSPGSATTATRSACPPSAARSTSRRPTSRTASSTRWRSGSRRARAARPQRGRRARERGRAVRRLDRPRRDRRRLGARLGRARRGGGRRRDKRPTVQVGDPFEEKKLLECSLELLERGLLVSLQDLGAAGLTSSASEMASKGEVGIDIDVAAVPLREADMEPFEVMVTESQERMLCVVEPAKRRRGARRRARSGRWTARRSAPSPTAGGCACCATASCVGDMPVRALVDDCPLYDLEPAEPAAADLPAARGDPRAAATPARDAAGAARERQPRLAPPAVRAVRRDRPVAHGAPARAGRRGGARAARRQRARGEHRLQRPPRRRRPLPRHDRGGARVRRQPRLRRRRAARHDQQPQLRQPREAAHRLAADRVGARARRGLPRAARRRSSAATSRSTTRAPPARSTRRR